MAAAQSDLVAQIARLRDMPSSGEPLAQAQAQQYNLSRLQSRIANADAVTLGSIRAEIVASVVTAQSLVQQAQPGSASAKEQQVALHEASEKAQHATEDFMRDYYEKKEFDPYLRFASKQDEEEYREREKDYHRRIDAARAEHTPEGNLQAARLSLQQLEDAGAHGADRSAEYAKLHQRLSDSVSTLSQTLHKDAHSKDQAKADPLDSVKPAAEVPADVLASLRKAGVSMADHQGGGLPVAAAASTSTGRGGRS